MLAAVALAGGRSSRMGQDKSALPLPNQHQSLLEHCQQLLLTLGKVEVYVSGAQHKNGITDIYPNCGPLSGIHAVLSHINSVKPSIDEVLFVPVDMPALTHADLALLVKSGRMTGLLSCFENQYFPLYVPTSVRLLDYLQQCLAAENQSDPQAKNKQFSIKNMLSRFSINQVTPTQQSSFININTPQQWQQHCQLIRAKGN